MRSTHVDYVAIIGTEQLFVLHLGISHSNVGGGRGDLCSDENGRAQLRHNLNSENIMVFDSSVR
jgi:hypothetical protein